jgi:hypothetical protein
MAGLKLIWYREGYGENVEFFFQIAGDQVDLYPVSVPRLREVIKQAGLSPR